MFCVEALSFVLLSPPHLGRLGRPLDVVGHLLRIEAVDIHCGDVALRRLEACGRALGRVHYVKAERSVAQKGDLLALIEWRERREEHALGDRVLGGSDAAVVGGRSLAWGLLSLVLAFGGLLQGLLRRRRRRALEPDVDLVRLDVDQLNLLDLELARQLRRLERGAW